MPDKYDLLRRGCLIYWGLTPAVLGLITRSLWFLFVVWLQPLICMTFFLAIINWGFHAFIDFDENGKQLACVNALTILDGQDDYFGEDDHMVHHYSPQTWYTQTQTYHDRVMEDHRRYVGSVFKGLSIVELGVLIIFNQFELLAEKHFVDHSGKLSTQQIAALLRRRARTKELSFDEYHTWLRNYGADERRGAAKAKAA